MSDRYCILCVDDDVSGLEARAALLEEEGYSVTAVSCPLRALKFDATEVPPGYAGFGHVRSERISDLATFACSTRIFSDRVAQRYESEFTERHPQCVLKLPRQRRTDTSFAEYLHSYLTSIPDPPECRITDNDARPLCRRHGR
jgi:CheY-like chemotaxis protein